MNIKTRAFKRCEIKLYSTKTYANPFMDVNIDAVFTSNEGETIKIPGFWNGENEWKVRFSSQKAGEWKYEVTCTDKENTSLTDTGVIEVAPCENPETEIEKHGYVRLEQGKKHMVYGDGTPFFYLGDTHWMMPDYEHLNECNYPGCNCGNQFKHLADDRLRKGFNVYQTYFCADRKYATHSKTPSWWSEPYTLINPKAFNESMDIMMEYLADKGFTISLGFGTHHSTPHNFNRDVVPMLAFARYCVARYACYPLIWITAQEITNLNDNAFELWQQVGALVGELDGFKRPNGAHMHVHPYSDPRSQQLEEDSWHQWWTVQGGHGGIDQLRPRAFYESYYNTRKNKPFIETENQYEDIYCSGFCGHDAPRIGAWRAVLFGSAGFTYGVTGIWVLSWNNKTAPTLQSYSPEDWRSGIDKLGSDEVGYMRKFFEFIDWANLVPEYGFDYGLFENRSKVAMAHKGKDTFVYLFYGTEPETGAFTNLKENTRYTAHWFDTATGKFIKIDDIVTVGDRANIPPRPTLKDWVLLLTTEDYGEYDTEEYPHYIKPIPPEEAHCGEEYKIYALRASTEDEAHPAGNLIDGNPETFWRADVPYTSQTIFADLGESKDLGYVHFECDMKNVRYVKFRVYASNDGVNYDMLVERLDGEVATGGRFNRYFETVSGRYRYIKLWFNSLTIGELTWDTHRAIDTPLELTRFAVFAPEK